MKKLNTAIIKSSQFATDFANQAIIFRRQVNCNVCHSQHVKNCYECHFGRDKQGFKFYKNKKKLQRNTSGAFFLVP